RRYAGGFGCFRPSSGDNGKRRASGPLFRRRPMSPLSVRPVSGSLAACLAGVLVLCVSGCPWREAERQQAAARAAEVDARRQADVARARLEEAQANLDAARGPAELTEDNRKKLAELAADCALPAPAADA